MCWTVGLGCVLLWLALFPISKLGVVGEVGAMAVMVLLALPWAVASSKHAHRLTDRWPELPGAAPVYRSLRLIAVVAPMAVLVWVVLVAMVRLTWPPDGMRGLDSLAATAIAGGPLLTATVATAMVLGFVGLWFRAGGLIRRASLSGGNLGVARVRLWIGVGFGVVGVCALAGLDFAVRGHIGFENVLLTVAVVVCGVLAVVYGSVFGSLHARICVIVGEIAHAEDELRREERNRLGVVAGDPSMRETAASADPPAREVERQIGPIGGHPDPPGL